MYSYILLSALLLLTFLLKLDWLIDWLTAECSGCVLAQIVGSEESWWRVFRNKDGSSVRGLCVGTEYNSKWSSDVLGGRPSVSPFAAGLHSDTRGAESSGSLRHGQERVHVLHASCCHLAFVLQHHLQDAQNVENGNATADARELGLPVC